MSYYESVFIARPDVSASQVEAMVDSFKAIVDEGGGSVGKTEYWGLKSLAYRIKKNRKGHYSLMNLEAPPGAVAELERNMRLNEDILRFMTIRVDELEEEPSVVMRSKGSRDDRRRRDDRGRREESRAPDKDAKEKPEDAEKKPEETQDAKTEEKGADA